MRVRKLPIELEAERYTKGMEDGYMCYEINGRFIGYWPKDGRADVFIQTYEIIQPKCNKDKYADDIDISTEVLK